MGDGFNGHLVLIINFISKPISLYKYCIFSFLFLYLKLHMSYDIPYAVQDKPNAYNVGPWHRLLYV